MTSPVIEQQFAGSGHRTFKDCFVFSRLWRPQRGIIC